MANVADFFENFQHESNKIEGIFGCNRTEVEALMLFTSSKPTIKGLLDYATVCQPNVRLRDEVGLDVQVGQHIAPRGGPDIPKRLQILLDTIDEGGLDSHDAHLSYLNLHPFTDGNGRSGRALWLFQMLYHERKRRWVEQLGFLQSFYYQTLRAHDVRILSV